MQNPSIDDQNNKGCPYLPVITMTQDFHVKALPSGLTQDNIAEQQASFTQLDLMGGVPDSEYENATDPKQPFHFGVTKPGSIFVWADSTKKIPESTAIPQFWPLVLFAKLQDDRINDPENLIAQGSKTDPAVVIQAITLIDSTADALFNSSQFGPPPPKSPADPAAHKDRVHVLIRPSAICFNAASAATFAQGGLLVTPFQKGSDPGTSPGPGMPERQKDIADLNAVLAGSGGLVHSFQYACLPKGRYAINAAYPTGQVWTTPNETGQCAQGEGKLVGDKGNFDDLTKLSCATKPRNILFSQSPRAILEIVGPSDPNNCKVPQNAQNTVQAAAVPDACLPCSQRVNPSAFPECAP
jgi:hypothetical protein